MKIKNENDFLGFLISMKQDNGNISAGKIIDLSGISDIDCIHYLKSLEEKGYIENLDMETYHIYPDGIYAYMPPKRKIWGIVKTIITYLLGLFTSLIGDIIEFFQ